MQGRIEFKKLQRDMKPRDAVISFQCFSPDFVRVSEMADDGKIHHQEVQRHSKVVAGNRRAIHLLCKTGRLREETGQARSFLRIQRLLSRALASPLLQSIWRLNLQEVGYVFSIPKSPTIWTFVPYGAT